MGRYVILNADDFGFSQAVNYGVMESYKNGVISSASLMVNLDAAEHAVALWRECPDLGLSIHVNLVQGHCCANPMDIPTLVQEDGSFYPSREYIPDGILKHSGGTRVPPQEEVKRETIAQLERFRTLVGRYPVHLEGHSILHPTIIAAFAEVAQEYGLHYMSMDTRPQAGFRQVYEAAATPATSLMDGYQKTGLTAEMVCQILSAFAENPHEVNVLHCHPGYVDAYVMNHTSLVLPRCRDVEAMCSPAVRAHMEKLGLVLLSFDEIRCSEI